MAAARIEKILSFEGLIVAPFTAFGPTGEINSEIIPKYVEYLYKQGVRGAFVNGTTGEGVSLNVEERKTIAEEWVKAGKNRCDIVIIQVGANSIKDALELAKHAEKIGATGIAALPPLFYKSPTSDHLVSYFKALSEAAPSLPLMLYHIPSYSGVDIDLVDFLPKARDAIPNFIGAKFTSVDVRQLLQLHNLPGPKLKLLSGFDEVLLPCLSCGVTAAVGATYNFMALPSLKILEAFKRGDMAGARKIQNEVMEVVMKIAKHGQPISCFKAAMNILGPFDVGEPRQPLRPLSADAIARLRADLKTFDTKEWSRA